MANSSQPSFTTTLWANFTGTLTQLNSSTGDVYLLRSTANISLGHWLVGANTTGNANWSDSLITTHVLTVYDAEFPQYSNLTTMPDSPATYVPNQSYQFNATWTDNVGIDKVLFEWDGSNTTVATHAGEVWYTSKSDLAVGTYTYRWFANDTSGNMAGTSIQNYTIGKAPATITLLLNGTDGDNTYATGKAANFTVTLNVSGKTVSLASDMPGWVLQNGTTPLMNYTTIEHVGRFNMTGYFPGDENYSSSFSTHYTRGGKADGGNCTLNSDCLGGHCVHGTCRAGSTYCGDGYCDTGENSNNCPADCPSSGGGLPPEKPKEEKPKAEPIPPVAPMIWPEPTTTAAAIGATVPVPSAGTTIVLRGSVVNSRPTPGTVGILIYPTHSEATIHNISEVVPSQLAPLSCNQQPLSSYEINISGDISAMDYCMDYTGKLGDVSEDSLSVWKLSDGGWFELPPDQVLHDTNIICGNITKAQTPYMIAGFTPILGVTPDLALASIRNANATIAQAVLAGKDIEIAQALLIQAENAYISCDYAASKELADRAAAAVGGLPVMPILIIIAIGGGAVLVYIYYLMVRKAVVPKMFR
jgi:hypothetical protein